MGPLQLTRQPTNEGWLYASELEAGFSPNCRSNSSPLSTPAGPSTPSPAARPRLFGNPLDEDWKVQMRAMGSGAHSAKLKLITEATERYFEDDFVSCPWH